MKGPGLHGRFAKHKLIEPCGLSVTKAARALGINRPALSARLNEHASFFPELARGIEKAFSVLASCGIQPKRSSDIILSVGTGKGLNCNLDYLKYDRYLVRKKTPSLEKDHLGGTIADPARFGVPNQPTHRRSSAVVPSSAFSATV